MTVISQASDRRSSLGDEFCGAARIVSRVAAGHSLAEEFARLGPASAYRPALQDIAYGTLRRYVRGRAIVGILSHRNGTDPLVQALLWCALYALESGRYAEYTVLDQAVAACTELGHAHARGFVNALLRGYLRRRSELELRADEDPEACHRHPDWWIGMLQHSFPDDWQAVLGAGNLRPPMCLRVNRRRSTLEAYLAKLEHGNLPARVVGDYALILESAVAVDALPGFSVGEVSVQDAGAQQAVSHLDLAPGQRVLDACAAPGGKSAHILESADVILTGLDIDASRCARTRTNLQRLGLRAQIETADCAAPSQWWDGVPFDRILADVPCSGSGIVRRHPDIKWLRRHTDIDAYAQRQGSILDALWHTLAAGGKLLYVTCSVFPGENHAVIESFCKRTQGARRLPLAHGRSSQILPTRDHDGFYFALLEKAP